MKWAASAGWFQVAVYLPGTAMHVACQIPGALRESRLKRLWERAAEVSSGGGVPRKNLSAILYGFSDFCTQEYPPSTFPLLCLNSKTNAQMASYCRKSFQRVQDRIRFSISLIRLIKRLVSDRDPTESIWWKLSKIGGGVPESKGIIGKQ